MFITTVFAIWRLDEEASFLYENRIPFSIQLIGFGKQINQSRQWSNEMERAISVDVFHLISQISCHGQI